ncbi:segregation/condensation protein A [Deferribacterales bacterium RsTz2092]|nr:segregation and condensation protein A [Deferribacterales bacterium]
MSALDTISIDKYEGPLDLLIHLVHKNEMNIFDVPISEITASFIEEIKCLKMLDVEVAAEFIQMASYLLYLKSRSMLPKEGLPSDELNPEDEAASFARALADLAFCKELALFLRVCEETSANYLYRRESVLLPKDEIHQGAYALTDAFFNITAERKDEPLLINSYQEQADRTAMLVQRDILSREDSLWSGIIALMNSPFECTAAFSTILVMAKNRLINVIQKTNFSDILIKRLQ